MDEEGWERIKMDTTKRDEYQQKALAGAIANDRKTADDIAKGLGQEISGVIRVLHASEHNRWVLLCGNRKFFQGGF